MYIAFIPLLTLAGVWVGLKSHIILSRVHPDVYLAELMISQPELREDQENLDIQAFLESGETFEQLVDQASVIREKFRKGSMAMGGFVGLALGITLMNQVVFRRKEDYEPHKGDCSTERDFQPPTLWIPHVTSQRRGDWPCSWSA